MRAPPRAFLMGGRYPQRCGGPANNPVMPPGEIMIPALLKPYGSATGVFGKWHLGATDDRHPNSKGFDGFFGFHTGNDHFSHRNYRRCRNGGSCHDLFHNRTGVWEEGRYCTELWTERAPGWLDANRTKPFFLYLPDSAVHYPRHAPRRYLERFAHLADYERRVCAAMPAAVNDGTGQGTTVRVLNLETIISLKQQLASEKDLAAPPVLRRTLEEIRKRGSARDSGS